MKFLAGLLAVLGVAATPATAALLTLPGRPSTLVGVGVRVAPSGLGRTFAVSGRKHDLEFDQFIPLRIGALTLGYRQQRLHALAR